jgi:hypothetical protein
MLHVHIYKVQILYIRPQTGWLDEFCVVLSSHTTQTLLPHYIKIGHNLSFPCHFPTVNDNHSVIWAL